MVRWIIRSIDGTILDTVNVWDGYVDTVMDAMRELAAPWEYNRETMSFSGYMEHETGRHPTCCDKLGPVVVLSLDDNGAIALVARPE